MLLNLASVVNADTPDMLWGFLRRYSPEATPGRHPFFDAAGGPRDRVLPGHRPARPSSSAAPRCRSSARRWSTWPEMLRALPADAGAEAIQDVVYEVGKRHPFPELKAWFACLYQVLLGQRRGRGSAGSSRSMGLPRRSR